MEIINKYLDKDEVLFWSFSRILTDKEKSYTSNILIIFSILISFTFSIIYYLNFGKNIFEFILILIFISPFLIVLIKLSAQGSFNKPSIYYLTNKKCLALEYSGKSYSYSLFQFNYEDITDVNFFEFNKDTGLYSVSINGKYRIIANIQLPYETKLSPELSKFSNLGSGLIFFLNEEGKKILLENLKKYNSSINLP